MFFTKKKKIARREPDKIWQTKAAKLEGLCQEILRLTSEGFDVLVVAHFKKSLEEIKTALGSKDLPYKILSSAMDVDLWRQGSFEKVSLILSEMVSSPSEESVPPEGDSIRKTYVIITEHYPLLERDQSLIHETEALASTLCFYDSLETPFLKPFGIDQVKMLLVQLGGDKTTFLSHAFISSAIENAQKKLAEKVNGDLPSDSDENWMAQNYPSN